MNVTRCLATTLAAVLLLAGCSSKKKSTAPPLNSTQAQQLVQQANTALGQIIAAQMSGPDPQRPSDIDFTQPYTLYQQALTSDPTNEDAMFGVAILGLMSLTVDASVNAAFDEWKSYLNAHVPFEVPGTPRPQAGPLGVPLRLGRADEALRLPFERFAISSVALARAGLTGSDPQLSGVQDVLEQRALPALTRSLGYLQMLANDPNFRFIVTPQMQGDAGADPIEIDRTDILALSSGCHLLTAMCDVAVAYNLSFATYDSAGLVQALQPGSGWLAFRTNGAARMAQARLAILDAVTDGEGCLSSLKAETDPQDDDAIKIDPADFSSADAESLKTYLGHVRTAMNSGFRITADWDRNYLTPDVALDIVPAALFTNPVTDWKSELPGYKPGVVRRPAFHQYAYNYGQGTISVTIPTPGYYDGYWSVNVYGPGSPVYENASGSVPLQAPGAAFAHTRFKTVQAMPNWAGDYWLSASFYGYLNAGTQDISVNWTENYSTFATEVFVPTITWNAADFSAWNWPDPDFRGLLPGIGSTDELLTVFGFDPSWWQPTVVLDWTGLGYTPVAQR